MTPDESWAALVHALTVEQFQAPKRAPRSTPTGDVAQTVAEARRIAERLAEAPQVGERRRALLETELVAWARERKAA